MGRDRSVERAKKVTNKQQHEVKALMRVQRANIRRFENHTEVKLNTASHHVHLLTRPYNQH